MGLDNGIVIKDLPKEDRKLFKDPFPETSKDYDDFEICYWRKCWGIREFIGEIISPGNHNDYNAYIDQIYIPQIIDALKDFDNKEFWDEYAESIWEYEEFTNSLKEQIENLETLYTYMEDNPDLAVYFYDSY